MTKNKIIGVILLLIGLTLNFSAIDFTASGFIAGAICAIGVELLLFEFPIFNKEKKS